MIAEDLGMVAVRSSGGRVLLHDVRPDMTRTVCGRYGMDRILPHDYDITGVGYCGVCRPVLTPSQAT